MKSIVDFTNKLKDYFATKQALTNKAPYLDISLSGSSATLESDLNSKWASLPNGMYVVKIGNQSTLYHGTMFKYSDTIGSIQFMDAGGIEYEYNARVGLTHPVLYFTSVACSATSGVGNFVNASGIVGDNDFTKITADHVVVECQFNDPGYIVSDVTWTTSNGNVKLNGNCQSATTVNLVLEKKGN